MSCTSVDPSSLEGGLGETPQDSSSPDVVVNTSDLPPGSYTESCNDCVFGTSFTTQGQTGTIQTLACNCGGLDGFSDIVLNVPANTNVALCPLETGPVLVPCSCDDTDCITKNTVLDSDLVTNPTYISSCSGCSVSVPADGSNPVLACLSCQNDKGRFNLTSIIVTSSVDTIANCDGQLVVKGSDHHCEKNKKSDLKKWLEKVWDDVKVVLAYILAHPAPSPTGIEDYYQAAAEGVADDTASSEDAVDSILTILGEFLGIL